MNIYIANSLTHVPRSLFSTYSDFIHKLAKTLQTQAGHVVKYALINSDPQLAKTLINERAVNCYLWDRQMVEGADLLIAEASFPSTGMGIELQIAEARNTPIILCFRDYGENKARAVIYTNPDQSTHNLQIGDGYVSLMALGIPTVLKVIKYNDTDEGIAALLLEIERFCSNSKFLKKGDT